MIAFRPVFDALEHASDASYYAFSRCWSTDDVGDNSTYVRCMVARRNESGRTGRWEPTDEPLLRHLLAPPDLDDGVQSLDYWRRRSRQVPWYRIRARREAVRVTVRWEQRVGAALFSQHPAPLEARLSAGVLLARARLGRWTRRARAAVLAAVTTVLVLVAVPLVAALVYLMHML